MKTRKEFLSGTLSTIILGLLKENDKMYGYEICQVTKQRTNNEIVLTMGAIYPSLYKLEKEGYIKSSKEIVNGRSRKYYSLNPTTINDIDNRIASLLNFSQNITNLLKIS
ncbi:PadR family transcriptional regulator [Flavobacteriaceae bacterium R38]|nr:PadR family transcriptional regulator [Flavobacteriaceae bacterium R38]